MADEIPLRPAAGWQLRSIPSMGAVALTIEFLVSPMESPDQAHPSPNFLFHTAQLRELAHAMLQAADKVDALPPSTSGLPTH